MKSELPKIKHPNLKSRVYELLMNMVIDGKYRENEMLPPERVLCEELGVSRTVIREAVKSLEARGILQVIHGVGIRVVPATRSDIAEAFMLYLHRQHRAVSMKDVMEVRRSIETEIVHSASARPSEADLRELREILDLMEKKVRDEDGYIRADLDFHIKLAHMTRNILFITILEALLIPLRQILLETFGVQDNEMTCRQLRAVFERIAAGDAEGARELKAEHLRHTEEALRARGKL